jgi:hypothetical protein
MNLYVWDSFFIYFSLQKVLEIKSTQHTLHISFIKKSTPSVLAFVRQEHITLFQQQIQPP